MSTLHPTADIQQTSLPQKTAYSSKMKAAIAAILLVGSSVVASAANNNDTSSESGMGNTAEFLLEVGSAIMLGAFVYYATQRPYHVDSEFLSVEK